jgi:hypothetical protein
MVYNGSTGSLVLDFVNPVVKEDYKVFFSLARNPAKSVVRGMKKENCSVLSSIVSRTVTTGGGAANKAALHVTYDHRLRRIGHPVRSAIHKPQIGRLVVGWVTTSEYLLLYVFGFVGQLYVLHFVLFCVRFIVLLHFSLPAPPSLSPWPLDVKSAYH